MTKPVSKMTNSELQTRYDRLHDLHGLALSNPNYDQRGGAILDAWLVVENEMISRGLLESVEDN